MFKIINIKNKENITIYIFLKTNQDLNALFKKEPNNEIFKNISQEDKKHNIIFVNEYIHPDDTINTIKKKIILAFNKDISYEEIYLFGIKSTILNKELIYNELSQNDRFEITKNVLSSYLLNLSTLNISDFESKNTYTYDDVLSLDIPLQQNKKIPIGISYNIDKKYPIVINPFDIITNNDNILNQAGERLVSTHNQDILLDYNILNNTLFIF